MQLSLFFFSADGARIGGDKYALLLDCVRCADELGLTAVWTPERHFHGFGGLYPNPSVLSAAIAARTKRIGIRAGSVVLPLHDPIRVAEEWAVVDNLSGGRVAIAFASGWNRTDFALRPSAYSDRHHSMEGELDCIRRLWRGEVIRRTGVAGEPVDVVTYPRPIQKELPFWLTSGSRETWIKAGRVGANVLSAFGGSSADLAETIQAYRQARRDHGHDPDLGVVTVMLHTFVNDDARAAEVKVRAPLMKYLRDYLSQSADTLPRALEESMRAREDEFLEVAFQNRLQRASLIGSAEKCQGLLEGLSQLGVNEVACLIDFGIDPEDVIASIPRLAALQSDTSRCDKGPRASGVTDQSRALGNDERAE
jgi:natural product biosynthesis luciferase-like monooxygenase protein